MAKKETNESNAQAIVTVICNEMIRQGSDFEQGIVDITTAYATIMKELTKKAYGDDYKPIAYALVDKIKEIV